MQVNPEQVSKILDELADLYWDNRRTGWMSGDDSFKAACAEIAEKYECPEGGSP